jgi:hypothetical protein
VGATAAVGTGVTGRFGVAVGVEVGAGIEVVVGIELGVGIEVDVGEGAGTGTGIGALTVGWSAIAIGGSPTAGSFMIGVGAGGYTVAEDPYAPPVGAGAGIGVGAGRGLGGVIGLDSDAAGSTAIGVGGIPSLSRITCPG